MVAPDKDQLFDRNVGKESVEESLSTDVHEWIEAGGISGAWIARDATLEGIAVQDKTVGSSIAQLGDRDREVNLRDTVIKDRVVVTEVQVRQSDKMGRHDILRPESDTNEEWLTRIIFVG